MTPQIKTTKQSLFWILILCVILPKTSLAQWEKVTDGRLPTKAFQASTTFNGEAMYIARATIDGGVHIGKTVAFDILGVPAAMALKGKGSPGDNVTGVLLDLDETDIQAFFTGEYDEAQARAWLGNATARHIYHLGDTEHPACAASPEVVEQEVSSRLESALATLRDVQEIRSVSDILSACKTSETTEEIIVSEFKAFTSNNSIISKYPIHRKSKQRKYAFLLSRQEQIGTMRDPRCFDSSQQG